MQGENLGRQPWGRWSALLLRVLRAVLVAGDRDGEQRQAKTSRFERLKNESGPPQGPLSSDPGSSRESRYHHRQPPRAQSEVSAPAGSGSPSCSQRSTRCSWWWSSFSPSLAPSPSLST